MKTRLSKNPSSITLIPLVSLIPTTTKFLTIMEVLIFLHTIISNNNNNNNNSNILSNLTNKLQEIKILNQLRLPIQMETVE